jgi:PTH1 family peptidyl-tRNA hydrolase
MKVICGLGNPGTEYAATRHNVGWWVLDEARRAWLLPGFSREGRARVTEGRIAAEPVRLIRPVTFMNRSGAALLGLRGLADFDPARDLMVVVDDAALDVGRIRIRARGSSGGHNGMKSVESVLGTQEWPRMRIGVGLPPEGEDLADWVLSPFPAGDEERVRALLPETVEGLRIWIEEGVEAAAIRLNR